jgi:uncharacterized membrane protein YqiK
MSGIATIITLIVIAVLVLVVVLAKLYRRSTREVSLIRTGLGGQKVVMDGGALVIPFFQEITPVNMATLRLDIARSGEASLITKDRLRVDIGAEFSVAVQPSEDGIARAAQTLGERVFEARRLKDVVEGKLLDALRAVAARMTMDELHENRAHFVQEVRELVAPDLLTKGLELHSVSLTSLDQTSFKDLDQNNAFNAVGMRKLAEVIAKARKERAEIDSSADVAVRLSAMEAARRKLEIDRDEEQARIEQQQAIETLRAAQSAEIARRRAESERESEAARIAKDQQVKTAEIALDRALRDAEIARERDLEHASIEKERALEIAQQERRIQVAAKSEEESRARAAADEARAEPVRAAEAVLTARQVAEAERVMVIALLEARKKAESDATRMQLLAAAERAAAADHGAARRETASSEADAQTTRAAARKAELLAEAEGQRALYDAENLLDQRIVGMRVDLARLEALPGILAEMVRPAAKIESIKIHQITGLEGRRFADDSGGGQTPVNQALDSILGMALQYPALKTLGEEISESLSSGLAKATGKSKDGAEDD